MADQPKKKNPNLRKNNDDRPSKKAFKQGTVRHRRNPQTELQKALMGGGAMRRIGRRVDGSTDGAWRAGNTITKPFDSAQALENRHLYPHLFS